MPLLLPSSSKDLGGFTVSRILPHMQKKMVGPFIFFDHMGPAHFPAGKGVNVRPHPHIGLATMTYLFAGSILHRDSLGSIQEVFPGDVNWMTAGKGIVHSERETLEVRGQQHELNGIQCWLALPPDKTDIEPSFIHITKSRLPYIFREKVMMRLIAGEAFNHSSPVKTYSPMFYLDAITEAGARVERPCAGMETAVYVINGEVQIGGQQFSQGDFVLLDDDDQYITSDTASRYMLLGGEKFQQTPHIYWNFVAFDKEKIEQAKQRWANGQFPAIPGDNEEHIPLP
ncbi:pirin family protein [Chromatiaceae bacterium AAb-1]|nr:pirin family protein [Chromatiaceae bacterium AAb-1]